NPPASVDIVDGDSLSPEETAIARAGRHHREHVHAGTVESLDGFRHCFEDVRTQRRGRCRLADEVGVGRDLDLWAGKLLQFGLDVFWLDSGEDAAVYRGLGTLRQRVVGMPGLK